MVTSRDGVLLSGLASVRNTGQGGHLHLFALIGLRARCASRLSAEMPGFHQDKSRHRGCSLGDCLHFLSKAFVCFCFCLLPVRCLNFFLFFWFVSGIEFSVFVFWFVGLLVGLLVGLVPM